MAVHFIHIRKSGGTAIKHGLGARRKLPLETPYGPLVHHPHPFRLADVEPGDHAFFSVRDPVTRFVSGFYSRLREGRPRNYRPWSEGERQVFGWFPTPQELADALDSRWPPTRARAVYAMRQIRHLRMPLVYWTGTAPELEERLSAVVYIARQETLDADFERLKQVLRIPADWSLPDDPVKAHRHDGPEDKRLTPEMAAAVRRWYAKDCAALEVCDRFRAEMFKELSDDAAIG